MKYFYFLFLFSFPFFIQAQCIADAGPDQHACSSFIGQSGDTVLLGGQPTASGGTAPYTYEWTFYASISPGVQVYASDLLDDITAANPVLQTFWGEEVAFLLKVTDANNVSCYDTVIVTFSIFTTHLGQYGMTVNAGDTITFLFGANVESNLPIKNYLWRPNHGMIDSTSVNPTVAPTHSMVYHVIITDSAGCTAIGGDYVFVTVNHVGIEESLFIREIDVYTNPVKGRIHITLPQELAEETLGFVLVDATGRIVESFASYSNEEIENEISLAAGIYMLKIFKDGQLLTMRKVVVQD